MDTMTEELAEFADSAVDNTEATVVTETVTLPSRNDVAGIVQLQDSLQVIKEKRGVTTLLKWLGKYSMHIELANEQWGNVVNSANYVNGIRSATQHRGDRKRSLRNDAVDFYNSLSTPALRLHCKLFEIDYDSYISMEEVIETLVQKHVDMVGVV